MATVFFLSLLISLSPVRTHLPICFEFGVQERVTSKRRIETDLWLSFVAAVLLLSFLRSRANGGKVCHAHNYTVGFTNKETQIRYTIINM